MTAEVAIMNKSAIALAADSAVTISPHMKVFNSAEKLFMLLPGHPIGLLIYNYPEFMQLPWETVIKKFRNSFSQGFLDTLYDYAEKFIAFLSNPNNGLVSDDQYNISFGMTANYYLSNIRNDIVQAVRKRIEDKAKRISLNEILDITSQWINKYHEIWLKSDNQYSENDTNKIIKDLEKYRPILNNVINAIFRNLPLSKINKRKLEEFCFSLFYKDKITLFHSGVVIAGFGEKDLYPSCVEFIIENCFCGQLKYRKITEMSVDPQTTGVIIPFAQKDIVKNILDGIHPDLLESLNNELEEVFSEKSITEMFKNIKGLRAKRKTEIIESIAMLKKERQAKVIEKIQSKFKKEHTDSILNTVSILPKDELANMSESLVNITSFVRRVSMEVESVGGPIDVAVISKKDGFVWIKRKHYFDVRLNPHFNLRYLPEVHNDTKTEKETG